MNNPLKVQVTVVDKARTMDGERVSLGKVWVSVESRDGWDGFCLAYGVTRSSVIEAIGLSMIDMVAGRLPTTRATIAVIERAKAVDNSRRRRL